MVVRNDWYGCCLIIYIWYEYYFWCEFWYEFDGKNNDFDRVVLFMNLVWLESIDFTGDLNDWWDVNRCILMCYFFIEYDIFGGVRWNAYFSMVWRYFGLNFGDFWFGGNW